MRKILLLLLGLPFLFSCTFKNAVLFPPEKKSNPIPIEDIYVVLLLIDGGRPQEVNSLVAAGKLPMFKELFFDQGARFENAIAVFPTVSTPSHQAFISGLFPGHHGVPNLDWFSRPLLKYIDLIKPKDISLTNTYLFNFNQVLQGRVETDQPHLLYHHLAGHPTMTVFETATSGATTILPANPPFVTAYHAKIEKFYEELDLRAIQLTLDQLQNLPFEKLPRFSYVSCYGMDLLGHFAGPTSDRVQDLYLHYDRFLRELKKTLQQRGIWEKSYLVVVSDHGQHELREVSDLPKMIHQIGLRYNKKFPKQGQVMYGDHGTSFSNLYFRIGEDWNRRPTYSELQNYPLKENHSVNLIEKFLAFDDIEFVLAPEGPWRTHIHARNQHAIIERRLQEGKVLYAYRPDPGQDPLRYLSDPALRERVENGQWMDGEAWLKLSHDKELPDAVVLFSQQFDDYRVGEMVLVTAKHTQFLEKRLAGHGSAYAEDLNVLMMLHGPKIKAGVYPFARSVDLFPTLLRLYGLEPYHPVDGRAREEIFVVSEERKNDFKGFLGTGSNGHELKNFRDKLQDKLQQDKLSKEEREKAVMLLYSLDQFIQDKKNHSPP